MRCSVVLRSLGSRGVRANASTPLRRRLTNSSPASSNFTSTASNAEGQVAEQQPEVFTDVYGRRLLRHEYKNEKKMPFYYDPVTFESYEQILMSKEKPKYATSWEDPKFPGWIQYMDSTGKRAFYVDRANPISQVAWAPPGEPDRDIFAEEQAQSKLPLMKVSDDVLGAPLGKRLAAFGIDVALSLSAGVGFGLLVLLDLGRIMDAAQGFGFSSWIFLMMRDSVFERGTRSPGKKYMGLEIVTMDGQLPTRWNTGFRQIYLPIYTGAALMMPYIVLLPVTELGLVLFTKRNYRIGDLIGQTRVILEQPDRAERFKEKCDRDDAENAKE